MERLKHIKESIMAVVETQLGNLCEVDTEELGEAIDMIKDLEEAMYYCSVVKAMEEAGEERKERGGPDHHYYYSEKYYPVDYRREKDWEDGRMYYDPSEYHSGDKTSTGSESSTHTGKRNYYHEGMMDQKDGRSAMQRRAYMESKESADSARKLKELEKYMQELTSDVLEMIEGASPEEKQTLQKKMNILASKLQNV